MNIILVYTANEVSPVVGAVYIGIVIVLGILLWIGAGCYLAKKTWACPSCGQHVKKKWYRMMFSVHLNGDRLMRCPKCHKKDFFSSVHDR